MWLCGCISVEVVRKGKCGSGVLKMPVECVWSLDKMKCYETCGSLIDYYNSRGKFEWELKYVDYIENIYLCNITMDDTKNTSLPLPTTLKSWSSNQLHIFKTTHSLICIKLLFRHIVYLSRDTSNYWKCPKW